MGISAIPEVVCDPDSTDIASSIFCSVAEIGLEQNVYDFQDDIASAGYFVNQNNPQ